MLAGGPDPLLPGDVVLVARVPGDVVDGPGALAASRVGLVVAPVDVAVAGPEDVFMVALVVEAEDVDEQLPRRLGVLRVGPRPLDALDGVLGGDARMLRDERRVAVGVALQLEREPVVVG